MKEKNIKIQTPFKMYVKKKHNIINKSYGKIYKQQDKLKPRMCIRTSARLFQLCIDILKPILKPF